MSLAELANLGDAIGGVAVLVTLVYLAVQMRQSTDLAQAAAQRDWMNSLQANLDRVARDPVLWQRGLTEFDSLSNAEQLKSQMVFNPFINHLEQTLRMHARGLETQDSVTIHGDLRPVPRVHGAPAGGRGRPASARLRKHALAQAGSSPRLSERRTRA